MIIIDANVWIAAHIYEEPHHERSRIWLRNKIESGEQFAAPRILLLEIPAALERRDKAQYRPAIETKLRRVRVRWTPVDDALLDRAIDITTDIRLKTLDCLYVAAAELLNVPLYTWDDEVVRRAAKRIRVYKPQ